MFGFKILVSVAILHKLPSLCRRLGGFDVGAIPADELLEVKDARLSKKETKKGISKKKPDRL
jgi:hypothetical protein